MAHALRRNQTFVDPVTSAVSRAPTVAGYLADVHRLQSCGDPGLVRAAAMMLTETSRHHTGGRLHESVYRQMREYLVFRAKSLVEWGFPDLAQRLESLRHLPIDPSRDGEVPPSSEVIDIAYCTLFDLWIDAQRKGIDLPRPYTYLTPEGGVQFEWEIGDREFDLEIRSKAGVTRYPYLLCPGTDESSWEEGEFLESPSRQRCVQVFLSWL